MFGCAQNAMATERRLEAAQRAHTDASVTVANTFGDSHAQAVRSGKFRKERRAKAVMCATSAGKS